MSTVSETADIGTANGAETVTGSRDDGPSTGEDGQG